MSRTRSTASSLRASRQDRDLRQRELAPPAALRRTRAVVAGCGAVGHQVARLLGSMGVSHITLIDFDKVDHVNLAPQLFRPSDVGKYKVDVVAKTIRELNPDVELTVLPRAFQFDDVISDNDPDQDFGENESPPIMDRRLAVFSCVDGMAARADLWKMSRQYAEFWGDTRMSGETGRFLTSVGRKQVDEPDTYTGTLYSDDDPELTRGSCTSRSLNCTAMILAGVIVHQFTLFLRGFPTVEDKMFNIKTSEIFDSAEVPV